MPAQEAPQLGPDLPCRVEGRRPAPHEGVPERLSLPPCRPTMRICFLANSTSMTSSRLCLATVSNDRKSSAVGFGKMEQFHAGLLK